MNLVPGSLIGLRQLPPTMTSYAASERALAAAIKNLHDYLWAGARIPESELLARLERGARDLDRHLGTRGRIERVVRSMTRKFRKVPDGADLFTYLQAVAGLSYAADRVRRHPKEAAKASSELAVSLTIHLAVAAGASALVESFESGREDFEEFSARVQGRLESRGVLRAAEFCRAADLAFDVHALWDAKASAGQKRIVVTASVTSAAFASVVLVDALQALGRYREVPYGRLVPVVATIVERLGGQA